MTMKAIMTGGTGFIGSALCREIIRNGGTVYALVREGSVNLSRLPENDRLIRIYGNLSDVTQLKSELTKEGKFDVFYHLAWEGVGNVDRNADLQLDNIQPTVRTLQVAKALGCHSWVATGSQAEYGPVNKKIREDAPTMPTTLYGASKLAASIISMAAGAQLGIETKWARVFSTYGPGDNSGWMLTDVIRRLLKGQQPALTKGEQLWDYLFVEDAAEALYRLGLVKTNSSGIYNLGSGKSQTIRSIVETVRDLIDPNLPLTFGEIPYRPDQVMHLEADIGKLTDVAGWTPRTSLENGLKQTIDYIRTQLAKEGPGWNT